MADVAPNNENTLTTPARRLPLGQPTACEGGFTLWRVYIPTRFGGVLHVKRLQGLILDIQQPLGVSIGTGIDEARAVVNFGECFVVAIGPDNFLLTASLVQTAWARLAPPTANPNAAPLLPWNFHFWGSRRDSRDASDEHETLRKYAIAVGKDPAVAVAWEVANHQVADGMQWEGHCHHMSPASAYFLQPAAQTINGQFFSEDEMEYLAGEWFGNFGNVTGGWGFMNPLVDLTSLKPSGPRDRAALERLVRQLNPGMTDENVSASIDTLLAGLPPGGIESWFRYWWGVNAKGFFEKLQDELCGNGNPLTANLRAYDPGQPYWPVWNQVVFYYTAEFAEVAATPYDDRDMRIMCQIHSNIDKPPPSSGLGGRFVNGQVVPARSGVNSWLYRHDLRLVFNDSGGVTDDARNDWISVTDDSFGDLFPPRTLALIAPMSGSPRSMSAKPSLQGNPVVGLEFLSYVMVSRFL